MPTESLDKLVAEMVEDDELFAAAVFTQAVKHLGHVEGLRYAVQRIGVKLFADRSGLSHKSVSNFVSGKSDFTFEEAMQAIDAFGVTMSLRRKKKAA